MPRIENANIAEHLSAAVDEVPVVEPHPSTIKRVELARRHVAITFDDDSTLTMRMSASETGVLVREATPGTSYVQVRYIGASGQGGASGSYTYIDPGLGLKVGELVDVPTFFQEHNAAIVTELGPGKYGPSAFDNIRTVGGRYRLES